ncbi:MAG: hypothetical protein L3J18_07295 [Candidatus Brocadia sp.]|uniref:Uncharacterized protein n=1 Tax=Candidatus Brocadia fulgida TaxID=380242 RepID=A0A0M2UW08_9BACT|nr:MAG: hypothetical protein BROFUL_01536 [Candidatus Brocadia fulgida]UJS22107.1 MAG: hypothetical protein L3J18_07295 [Candidatus Brocadia sp.]
MGIDMQYLNLAKDAIREVVNLAPDLNKAIAKGEEQATTRDGVIQTINEMCDALQLASDLISKELSTSITEFNRIRPEKEEVLQAYFERVATKFSEPSLRLLLHEGTVCGELHKLGDRFEQPFSKETTSGVSWWENVRTFFSRSNSMANVLHGLIEGERNYLRSFSEFLDDVRDSAETATQVPWENNATLRTKGEELVKLMRQKRSGLQSKLSEIRVAADAALGALH